MMPSTRYYLVTNDGRHSLHATSDEEAITKFNQKVANVPDYARPISWYVTKHDVSIIASYDET